MEGAWASRDPAIISRHLQVRLEHHPKAIQDISWKAHVRRCTRDRRLMARGHHAHHIVVALARELGGFLWAMAKQLPGTPSVAWTDGACPHRRRLTTCLARGAAPVWCSPRRREEAETHPRASTEAGTRRTHARWEPTHGSPPDQPSDSTGSGSSDAPHEREDLNMQHTS